MHSRKRKKLLNVPGIISLIGVSILFYFFKPEYHQQYSLNVMLPTDKSDNEYLLKFSSAGIYAEAKRRAQTFVDLGYYSTALENKFVFIEQEILRLGSSYGQKPEVLIVKLNDETRFADYVQLLNLPKKYALKRYAHAGDSFYFFGLEPENVLNTPSTCFLIEPIYLTIERNWFDMLREWSQTF